MHLPNDTIRIRLKRWDVYFQPWIDFEIIQDNWFIVKNKIIKDWQITIIYDKNKCLCQPKNIYWEIKNWVLEFEF